MAIPSNITAATAIDVGTLPATITQDVRDAGGGITYDVWYKYTAKSDVVLALAVTGDLVTYTPAVRVFTGPPSAPVAFVPSVLPVGNQAIQIPVVFGTTYYFQLITNSAAANPAVLTFYVKSGVVGNVPKGSILVNDDTNLFAAVLFSSSVSFSILKFITAGSGENCDVLLNGVSLFENKGLGNLTVYSKNFGFIRNLALATALPIIRACRGASKFYVGEKTNPITVRIVNSAGNYQAGTFTLTGAATLNALAANNTETILYYAIAGAAAAIKRWDLSLNVAMSDLVAGIASNTVKDILVLSDDTILVAYKAAGFGSPTQVLHYSAAGAVLNTYATGNSRLNLFRIAYALDDPNSFWAWVHDTATIGLSHFKNVKVSDGSVLATIDQYEFEVGISSLAIAIPPTFFFGISNSCAFFITSLDAASLRSGLYKSAGAGPSSGETPKTSDTLYTDGSGGIFTETVAIPDPFATLYLAGEQ